MGAALSSTKLFLSVLALLISSSNAKPINLILGLAGTGKSTTIGNVCGVKLFVDNDIHAATTEALAVDCGDQVFVDTCGLIHLAKGKPIVENAFHDGLELLLAYMDGKEIGRIYLMIGSNYMRDYGRLLEQVDFLKSVVNPLIPWTAVINCMDGVCPSSLPPERVNKILPLLIQKAEKSIEVNAPKLTPADKVLFPVPKTTFKVNLPDNWRELIKKHDIDSIRANMAEKAVASCKEHQNAFIAASSAIKDHQCSVPVCAVVDCEALSTCPPFSCNVAECGNNETCRTTKTSKKSCGTFGEKNCQTVETGMDASCLDAITVCNTARAKSCATQLESVTKCNENRTTQCVSLQNTHTDCNTQRTTDCTAELNTVKSTHTATMEQHKPYVDQCQKFYTM